MSTEPLDIVPLWGLFLIGSELLWLVMEIGYRNGKWRHAHMPDERDQPVGAMVTSILGLVALVLGFTFSLAATRFDSRRLAVLEEANAIGTTYLRARLLPESQAAESARLLREYVDVRISATKSDRTQKAIAQSEVLHEQLWTQACAAAEKHPGSIMTGIYIQFLNDVIDVHAKRLLLVLNSRIPVVIWAGLFGLAILGLAAVGYQAGLSDTRRSRAMMGLVVAFTIVLLLIADLDRGHEVLLQVSRQSMLDLQRSMQPAPSPSGN